METPSPDRLNENNKFNLFQNPVPGQLPKQKSSRKKKRGGKIRKWTGYMPAYTKDLCPICYGRIRHKNTAIETSCHHWYHISCYGELRKYSDICSFCRYSFDVQENVQNHIAWNEDEVFTIEGLTYSWND